MAVLAILLWMLALAGGQGDPAALTHALQPRLVIPGISVDAPLTRFPLDGVSWAIDPWEPRPGHFVYTAWLDEPGNMVVGGHVEYPNGARAVFARLTDLAPGDTLMLRVGTRAWTYQVVAVTTVAHDDLTVLYPTAHPTLTLITCDEPSYNPATREYSQRVVVIAELVRGE